MSTTALVRSPSTPSGLTASPKPATPASTTTTVLPKLNLTPKTKTKPTQAPTPQPSTAGTSTPGQWQHPRMQEVIQRQNRTNFDKSNVWNIGLNATAILVTFVATSVLYPALPKSTTRSLRPYDTYALLLIRAFFAINILISLLPLVRAKDTCEDVPLTPAQRQLLGLPPMSRPATPQEKEQWITPPRYSRSRSATPQSAASSLRAQASDSPSSGSMFGATPQREGSGSPFSTQSYSPMLSGAAAGGGERRRLSYNARSSPLSVSDFDASTASTTGMGTATESTSTPTRKGNRASVGLNNKWLYEKGMGLGKGSPRRGSNGTWDPKGWGTGSVFN